MDTASAAWSESYGNFYGFLCGFRVFLVVGFGMLVWIEEVSIFGFRAFGLSCSVTIWGLGGVRKVGIVQMRCMLYGSDNVGIYILLPLGSEAVLVIHMRKLLWSGGGPTVGLEISCIVTVILNIPIINC